MDAPRDHTLDSMQAAKLRVFGAMRPLEVTEIVRGQFAGYREEPGVAAASHVETFVALCLHSDTPRWNGVPFYIRAGKRLPRTATEVMVRLKRPPHAVFDDTVAEDVNYFRFRLGPEVVISLGARVKQLGEGMHGEGVELIARNRSQRERLPYARLLGDAIRGDGSLFTRDDCVEAAWRVVDPVLSTIGGRELAPPLIYAPGTWGPSAADGLVADRAGWDDPKALTSPPC